MRRVGEGPGVEEGGEEGEMGTRGEGVRFGRGARSGRESGGRGYHHQQTFSSGFKTHINHHWQTPRGEGWIATWGEGDQLTMRGGIAPLGGMAT